MLGPPGRRIPRAHLRAMTSTAAWRAPLELARTWQDWALSAHVALLASADGITSPRELLFHAAEHQ
eukprot:6227577-Pyramimonas_sp.AAC.1